MFLELDTYISRALADVQASLPRNPHLTSQLQAKIAMLSQPGLASEISRNRHYAEGSVTSRSGVTIPVVTIFPLAGMRVEAEASVRELERVAPLLENYLATAFPYSVIRIWYGFVIGNSGGGGSLFMEDRTTYDARTSADRLPYDAILAHEHAHSYVSNEAMTQFLELYAYNLIRTGSRDVQAWPFTRAYVAFSSSNINVSSLLDVYQWIGADGMSRGYQAVLPLRPPYGSPLSEAVKQAFAATVPEALRAQVHAKLSTISF
jgi:hypothetical protein